MPIDFTSQTSHLCDDHGVIHVAHGHDALGWLPLCVLRDDMLARDSLGNWVQPCVTSTLVPVAHAMLTCVRCVVGGNQRRYWSDDV